jgi:hypothetical protein
MLPDKKIIMKLYHTFLRILMEKKQMQKTNVIALEHPVLSNEKNCLNI